MEQPIVGGLSALYGSSIDSEGSSMLLLSRGDPFTIVRAYDVHPSHHHRAVDGPGISDVSLSPPGHLLGGELPPDLRRVEIQQGGESGGGGQFQEATSFHFLMLSSAA